MSKHTHLIHRPTGNVFIRTDLLDEKADMIPAVWDAGKNIAVPYNDEIGFIPDPEKTPDENALRFELKQLTKDEIDQLAQSKFGSGLIDYPTKAAKIEAFITLQAEAGHAIDG